MGTQKGPWGAGRCWWGPSGSADWRSAGVGRRVPAKSIGFQSRGFELGYLEKVSEVKDTVHRQSLLYHLCQMVVEKFPETTDLYSEIASITRSAKVRQGEGVGPVAAQPYQHGQGLTSHSSRLTLKSWPTAWCSWSGGAGPPGTT